MNSNQLLAELYQGDAPMMVRLRKQLSEIARTPGLVTVLIEGPPGTGKTTMARALAMARVLSMVDSNYHGLTLERAARDVREGAALNWYRDISLAGLTETLADAQLFGVGKGVATEVAARIGIFEQAMTGYGDPKTAKSHSTIVAESRRTDLIPLVTGGIVLLDEVGDLPPQLQAKLLRVLNGEMQFRVGMEGNPDFGFAFRGLVVLATWRDIDTDCQLRSDLRQRICQHRIHVPGISDYPTEVRLQMVVSAAEVVKNEIREEMAHIDDLLMSPSQPNEQHVLASDWLAQAHRSAEEPLSPAIAARLADVDWTDHGQLRGLRATLRRILSGGDLDQTLFETHEAFATSRKSTRLETGIERLARYLTTDLTYSDAWLSDRHQWSSEMLRRFDENDPAIRQIVAASGRSIGDVKKELRNLTRSGSSPGERSQIRVCRDSIPSRVQCEYT